MRIERSLSDELSTARLSRRDLLRGLAAGAVALGAAGCAVPGFKSTPTSVPSSGASLLMYKGHSKPVNGLVWSADGARIASASSDNTANIWNATTGETLLTYKGHTKEVWDIGWSADGARIVTGSADNTAQVWDAQTAKRIQSFTGQTNDVNSVTWSPDSNRKSVCRERV